MFYVFRLLPPEAAAPRDGSGPFAE